MTTHAFSILTRVVVAGGLALGLACSSGHTGTTTSTTSKALTSSTTPAAAYTFFDPQSETELKAGSVYGSVIAKVDSGMDTRLFAKLGFQVAGRMTLNGATYYRLTKGSDVLSALQALKVARGVLFAEPELAIQADAGITYDNPDPKVLSEEYSVAITQAKEAWTTYGFGSYRPVVVDVDTGVDFGHEDLTAQVTHAFSWYDLDNGGALIDGSSDYTVQPIDYVGTAYTSTDGNEHGTHTAGTIAATGNNGVGVAGVCWNVDLMSYKGLSDAGSGGAWAIYGSLYHLVNWKKANYAHTIPVNMSLGGTYASQFAVDMVEYALENNVVVIASMGNDGQNITKYPAAYSGVIAVGATTGEDKKVHFSDSGRHISVCAPGYDIISTYAFDDAGYVSESGTSMSAPFVTGLVGYMLTFAPDLRPDQIKTYLEANADYIEGATGFTEDTGWGRVNVLKTIGSVVSDVNAKKTPATSYVDGRVEIKATNTVDGSVYAQSGLTVSLYQCDATGKTISNYVASSLTLAGSVTSDASATTGSAYFNLLRPGYYLARSVIAGTVASTPVFEVKQGSTVAAQTISFALPIYNIETLPDEGSTGDEDSVILLYSSTGTLLATYDVDLLDTATYVLPSGTYILGIHPFQNAASYQGEYALWVGPALYGDGAASAPGTLASPSGFAGSQSTTLASPQAMQLNQLYNCNMVAGQVDYYTVTIP
nr:S8 family serine peptidase [uncultured Holophaga sp.]